MENNSPAHAAAGAPTRPWLTIGALIVLLGVVAVSSRVGPTGTTTVSIGPVSAIFAITFETALLLGFIAGLAITVLSLWAFFPLPKANPRKRPGALLGTLMGPLALLLLAYLVIAMRRNQRPGQGPAGAGLFNTNFQVNSSFFAVGYEWIVLTLTLLIVAFLTGLVAWRFREKRPSISNRVEVSPAGLPLEGLTLAAEDALGALRRERNARTAVIAAYLRLLEGLAARGWPRGQAETAQEYLSRLTGSLEAIQRPLQRLTELFELARFAPRPVEVSMKAEAITALQVIHDHLVVRSPAD